MKRLIISYLAGLIIFNCVMSCGDKKNSESYYFLSEYEALDVGYPYGSMVYKSLQEYSFSNISITSNVLAFKQNSKYVVVKQNLDIGLLRTWISESVESFIESNGYKGERKELEFYNYVLPDTLVLKYDNSDSSVKYLTNLVLASPLIQKAEQNDTNYWIIQIESDSLIGPLTKSEFEITRRELKISDRLKLD